ncbi:glycine--tRNA ligase, partial [candidate division WWE3 bacterium]|nr:glycine--tRNA ligase [candidate division WWE3 bacterium]
MSNNKVTLEKIVAFCKRRGFVYQSAEIYGGLNGVYDFGPLGTLLKQNIRQFWTNSIYQSSDNIFLFEGSLLTPTAVWEASGHLENFNDPMVDCTNCKHRFRADELDLAKPCSVCGKTAWTDVRQFNLMFKTHLGAMEEKGSAGYLRPETAQSVFVNFKNVISTNRAKLPFGIAQIGKSFRNEITPKQFLFRTREFEQMELEWFCKPENSTDAFEFWMEERKNFYKNIGLKSENIQFKAHAKEDLSHYSLCCTDVEYNFPFGWKELDGLANRTDFDLKQHSKHSGKELSVFDEETKQTISPHVVEWSIGVDRLFLTLLFDSYTEDEVDGESRVVLKLKPKLAPIKGALLPL